MNEGINLSKLHESESVILCLSHPVLPTAIARSLRTLGFKQCDDFCFLPRADSPPPWQANQLASVTFFRGDTELNYYLDNDSEPEPLCDRVVFAYLLASLPAHFIPQFLAVIRSTQSLLGGALEHRKASADIQSLERTFASYVADVSDELAEEPGTEFLARIIHESYPRTRDA